MSYDRKAVGRRIRSGIAEMGLNYQEFGKLVGTSPSTISYWCTGCRGISLDNAVKLADMFGWPLDKLACRGDAERLDP